MEKNSLWHFTSGNGIKFMMCISLITVQLLYMFFQLSQSITIMWDFIFHLWKEERDIETIKRTEKIKTDFCLWWATKFGVHIVRRNIWSVGVFMHWLILTSTGGPWWSNLCKPTLIQPRLTTNSLATANRVSPYHLILGTQHTFKPDLQPRFSFVTGCQSLPNRL